jgi:hypothetical protein
MPDVGLSAHTLIRFLGHYRYIIQVLKTSLEKKGNIQKKKRKKKRKKKEEA